MDQRIRNIGQMISLPALLLLQSDSGVLTLGQGRLLAGREPGDASVAGVRMMMKMNSDAVSEPTVAPLTPAGGPAPQAALGIRVSGSKDQSDAWKAFLREFGEELTPEFSPEGFLLAVRGNARDAGPSTGVVYSTEADYQQASAHVLEMAGPLMGVTSDSRSDSLKRTSTHAGPLSGQVFYQQYLNELPVLPAGSVRVDLGAHGELINLDSSYVQGAAPKADFRLGESEARARARSELAGEMAGAQLSAGRKAYWSGSAGLRPAYVYSRLGKTVVIDGELGTILSKKMNRQE